MNERLTMLLSLQNFMVPLRRHLEVGHALDALIRFGYVGRAPRTPEHTKIAQSLYEMQMQGISFRQKAATLTPQLSTSLIGISGMGKTTTVLRWCAHIPEVIYHPEFNLYQVPYLHIEMSSDGKSVKGLAHAILHKLDKLIPGAHYFEDYAQNGKTGSDSLMRSVATVMNTLSVGILIVDEVQNLTNSSKGSQVVMSELTSACNELRVPIFFVGTNKAARVLSLDLRQARRSTGHGVTYWDRLQPGAPENPSEWDDILEILWSYQWVKKPVPLNDSFRRIMFEYSQGVIDIAIKILAASQARAISDGSETLTPELIADVYTHEFQLLHPMIRALRDDDFEALARFDDISPIGLDGILDAVSRRVASSKSPLYSLNSSDPTYRNRLASSVTALGFPPDEALAAVDAQISTGKAVNVIDGVQSVISALVKPKPTPRARNSVKKSLSPVVLPMNAFDETPGDYRRAIAYALHKKTDVMTQLMLLNMAPSLESIVTL